MSTTAGKVALITGAAQGIGRGIALRLAKDGFDIALNDLASKCDELRTVADDVEKIGQRTLVIPGDASVEADVKGMVEDVCKELGGLDVMVANAGIFGQLTPLVSTELEAWERVMTVNTRSTFLCYKYAAQQMIKQGRGGRIIGASSSIGRSAIPLAAPYCASKFAIRSLTQSAAIELGRYSITVNSYTPGFIETPLLANLLDPEVLAKVDPELFKMISNHLESIPIKRNGQTEDVAHLVSYLASKEAGFITGKYSVSFAE